jgi:hypothetical protein
MMTLIGTRGRGTRKLSCLPSRLEGRIEIQSLANQAVEKESLIQRQHTDILWSGKRMICVAF